jgi:hypothetical protein
MDGSGIKDQRMTQGFPAQPQFGQPQQPQYAPQAYAPPAPPQFQQGMGAAPGFFTQQDPAYQAQQQYAMGPQGPVVPAQQSAPSAPQPTDTSGFFGGGASISWDDKKGYVLGTPRGGQIMDKKITDQTKLGTNEIIRWPNGEPRKQMELTLQTAERADPQDDGRRRMFIKGDLPRASREAMKTSNARDLEIGGWFYAAWVSSKKATQPGFNDQKVFSAVYAPPGAPDPMAGQPAYTASAPPPVPVPQPSAPVDQYAAYAAQQAQGGPVQQPQMPQQPVAAANDQQAQFAAWQAQQAAAAQQPGAQPNGPGSPPAAAPGTPPGAQQPVWTPFS